MSRAEELEQVGPLERGGRCDGGHAPDLRGATLGSALSPATRPSVVGGVRVSVEYQVVNPITGAVESQFPTATDEEIAAAIERSAAAYRPWSETAVAERAAVLNRVADLYAERIDRARGSDHPRDGQDHGGGRRRDRVRGGHLPLLRGQRPDAARRRADPVVHRRQGDRPQERRSGRCSGSCRGTTPTTRSRASRARTSWWATRSCSSTPRSARSRPSRWSSCSATPA